MDVLSPFTVRPSTPHPGMCGAVLVILQSNPVGHVRLSVHVRPSVRGPRVFLSLSLSLSLSLP